MKNFHWSIIVAVIAMLVVLAACGGSAASPTSPAPAATTAPSTGGGTTPQSAATTAPSASGGGGAQLQLLGWASSTAEDNLLKQMIANANKGGKYNASFNPVPNYDQSLQTALAGGSPPDVFYLDSLKFPDFNKNGVLATPPSGALEDPTDFYPALAAAFTANGTMYCPPKDFSTLGLIYNKKMLDAAGVKVPTTWDELKAAAQKLTDKSKGVYGLVLPADAARWGAFLYQSGGHFLDSNGKMDVNTPQAKAALDFYTGFFNDGTAVTPDKADSGWPGEAFGKQKAAMVVEGNWIVPFLQQSYPDVSYGVAELPAGQGGKATLAFTVCYAVPKSAKNAADSWALVNDLTNKAGMQQWTDLGLAMPTRKSLRDHWSSKFPNLQAFLAGADYSHAWSFGPGFSTVVDTFNKDLQGVIAGQMTTQQVLQDTQKAGQQALGQ